MIEGDRATCKCPDACPLIYSPICGSDGVSYGNTCEMEAASCRQLKEITLVNQGMCGMYSIVKFIGKKEDYLLYQTLIILNTLISSNKKMSDLNATIVTACREAHTTESSML